MAAGTVGPYATGMNSTKTKRLSLVVLLGILLHAAVGAGCNTTKGLGGDVEKLGGEIQEKHRADRASRDSPRTGGCKHRAPPARKLRSRSVQYARESETEPKLL